MFGAFNNLQSFLAGGGNPLAAPTQAWLENQVNPAVVANYGGSCLAVFGVNCTVLTAANFPTELEIGDSSDLVFFMYQNGLLRPNVGVSGQFGTNIYISNQGSSSYNGMLVSVRKRFSEGFQFDFNYTLSHSIDNQSSIVNTVAGGLVCDLTNLRVCRGNSDFDIRHLVNVNGIWELPFGRGRMIGSNVPGWANQIIGGWELSGILTARSGLTFSTTTGSFPVGFNFNAPGVVNGSASALQGQIHDAPGNTIQFFPDGTAAQNTFAYPRHGEIGNRNILTGPGFWVADMALLKNFNLPWEGKRIQLRIEAYNVFNHNSFALPNTNISGTTFGQITASASAPREFQFALRFDF
jgi:hypothetical protein